MCSVCEKAVQSLNYLHLASYKFPCTPLHRVMLKRRGCLKAFHEKLPLVQIQFIMPVLCGGVFFFLGVRLPPGVITMKKVKAFPKE